MLDVHTNQEADRLAEWGCNMPLQDARPTVPSSIVVAGTKVPTPAKKWISEARVYPTYPDSPCCWR